MEERRVVTSTDEEQVADSDVPHLQNPGSFIVREVGDSQVSTDDVTITVASHSVRVRGVGASDGDLRRRVFQHEGLGGVDAVQGVGKVDVPVLLGDDAPRTSDPGLLGVFLVEETHGTVVGDGTPGGTQVGNTRVLLFVLDADEPPVFPVGRGDVVVRSTVGPVTNEEDVTVVLEPVGDQVDRRGQVGLDRVEHDGTVVLEGVQGASEDKLEPLGVGARSDVQAGVVTDGDRAQDVDSLGVQDRPVDVGEDGDIAQLRHETVIGSDLVFRNHSAGGRDRRRERDQGQLHLNVQHRDSQRPRRTPPL